jgi:hypothetical protein
MERYFDAKRRLFGPDVPAAVNVGDEHGRRLAVEFPHALTYGFVDDAQIGPDALEGVDPGSAAASTSRTRSAHSRRRSSSGSTGRPPLRGWSR